MSSNEFKTIVAVFHLVVVIPLLSYIVYLNLNDKKVPRVIYFLLASILVASALYHSQNFVKLVSASGEKGAEKFRGVARRSEMGRVGPVANPIVSRLPMEESVEHYFEHYLD